MTAPRVLVVTPELHERFWSKVRRAPGNACWPWTAGKLPAGYGVIQVKLADGRFVAELAHRVAWALTHGNGKLPPKGVHICHDCPGGDNPACVRPSHLWKGDGVTNALDRDAKGRTARGSAVVPASRPRGEDHYATDLTKADVIAIRTAAAAGTSLAALGERYHLTKQAIWRIVQRKTWRSIP